MTCNPIRLPHRCLVAAAVLLVGIDLAGAAPDCGRYAQRGILPGMTARQVQAIRGGEGLVGKIGAGGVLRAAATYQLGEETIVVEYDDDTSRRGSTRVAKVRRTLADRFAAPEVVGDLLREAYGDPTSGADVLSVGLPDGTVVWEDPACGIVVRAARQPGDWWRPGGGGVVVEVESTGLPAPARETARPREPSPLPEITAPSPAQPAESLPARVSEPERIEASYVAPVYPERARRSGVTARVVLELLVLKNGTVGEVSVVEPGPAGFGFEDAAVRAVRRWRYRPASQNGEPVDAVVRVALSFR